MKSIDFGRFRSSRMMKFINAMMNIISSRVSLLGVVKSGRNLGYRRLICYIFGIIF